MLRDGQIVLSSIAGSFARLNVFIRDAPPPRLVEIRRHPNFAAALVNPLSPQAPLSRAARLRSFLSIQGRPDGLMLDATVTGWLGDFWGLGLASRG